MSGFIGKIRANRLFKNSAVFFSGTVLASVGNYLFHFLMARLLDVRSYGELQSLLALLAILSIPSGVLATIAVRYAASFQARGELGKIRSLFTAFTKKLLVGGLLLFLAFGLAGGLVAAYLRINSPVPLLILGASLIVAFPSALNGGLLRGLQKFWDSSIVGIVTAFSKVIFAVLLVGLSLRLNGAVAAVVLSGFIGYFFSFLPLKFLFKQREGEPVDAKAMLRYSLPVFFSSLFAASLFNADLILVKHFFTPELAGQYGALAVVGHAVFFIVGPVVSVMFPMAAQAQASGGGHFSILKSSFLLVSALGLASLAAYFLLPGLIVRILVGAKFLPVAPYLGWYGLAMLLYAFVFLLFNYLLSLHSVRYVWALGAGAAAQVLLISAWHASLWQVVWAMNGAMAVTLVLLLLFSYPKLKIGTVGK